MSRDVEQQALSAFVAASAACLMTATDSRIEPHCEALCDRSMDLEMERLRELSATMLQSAG